jgi:hypothetical protein
VEISGFLLVPSASSYRLQRSLFACLGIEVVEGVSDRFLRLINSSGSESESLHELWNQALRLKYIAWRRCYTFLNQISPVFTIFWTNPFFATSIELL